MYLQYVFYLWWQPKRILITFYISHVIKERLHIYRGAQGPWMPASGSLEKDNFFKQSFM